jgi:REP element-mobilizing transposase RayT
VATVTFRRRALLVPDPLLRAIVVGFLARAGRAAGVPVCAFSLAHDHYHLLLRVPTRGALGRFMAYFNAGLAREVNRRTGCGSPVWARGYRALRVPDEPEVQEARLAALLARKCAGRGGASHRRHPDSVWSAAPADQSPLAGIWFDRSGEGSARRRGGHPSPFAFAIPEPLLLAPLPAWDALPAEERRARLASIVAAVARPTDSGADQPAAESHPRPSEARLRPDRFRTRLHLVKERCWVFGRRGRGEAWLA